MTTSDPNTGGVANWPAYDPAKDDVFTLQPGGNSVTGTFAADHQCAFWDQLLSR